MPTSVKLSKRLSAPVSPRPQPTTDVPCAHAARALRHCRRRWQQCSSPQWVGSSRSRRRRHRVANNPAPSRPIARWHWWLWPPRQTPREPRWNSSCPVTAVSCPGRCCSWPTGLPTGPHGWRGSPPTYPTHRCPHAPPPNPRRGPLPHPTSPRQHRARNTVHDGPASLGVYLAPRSSQSCADAQPPSQPPPP